MGLCRRLVRLWIRRSNCSWSTGEDEEQKRNFEKGKSSDIELAAIAEAVAVEAFAEDEVYSVPGHEDGKKAGDRTDSQAIPATPTAEAAVEQNNIGKEGDEGPRLLGIPVPEATPRVVCPNSSQDNSRGKEQDSDLQAAIKVKDPRVIRRRQRMGSERADDEKVREAGRESEGTVA